MYFTEDAESGSSMETSRMERRSSMKQGGRRVRRASITYRDEITNTLPSGETVQRRRSVGFDALAEVSHLEPTMNLIDNSKELWFQRNEFHMIRERARSLTNLAKSIREGNLTPSAAPKITSRTCLRGLESFIDSDFVKYEQHEAWKSVFIEQDHQKTACNFDEEIVAYHYGIASMPATARALKRAQGDVVDAEKHTRTILRRHSSL